MIIHYKYLQKMRPIFSPEMKIEIKKMSIKSKGNHIYLLEHCKGTLRFFHSVSKSASNQKRSIESFNQNLINLH